MRPIPSALFLAIRLMAGPCGSSFGKACACLLAAAGAAMAAPAPSAQAAGEAPAEGPAPDTATARDGQAAPGPAVPAPAPVEAALPVLPVPGPAKSDSDRARASEEPVPAEAPGLSSLKVGGTFQLKAFSHDVLADADADKSQGLDLRRARVDLSGGLGESFAWEGQFLLEGDGARLGTEDVFLAWKAGKLFGIKGGKLMRPFSQEAMQSSKSLYTVERGVLYQRFLSDVTGYSSRDLGLVFHGGFVDEDVPVSYEVGLFNGKQSGAGEGYADQHHQDVDAGFKAKDLVFRLVAEPFELLRAEAAVSTKAAEDRSDPENFAYHVNTAYQVGMDFRYGPLRILGEAAWGDNHQGSDARIVSGSSLFFAFYGAAAWREDYSRGRASELVLKLEGLDPDFEFDSRGEDDSPNDGRLFYTLGCNWFFTPRVSVLANYGVLQPLSKVPGEDVLVHNLDALWRMSF